MSNRYSIHFLYHHIFMNFDMIYITVFFQSKVAKIVIQLMKTYVFELKCYKFIVLFSFYFDMKILVLQSVTFPP